MSLHPRVLPNTPYDRLGSYVDAGGGAGLDAARRVEAEVVIGELEASGLRGRGGGGFPTGAKWRTVAANRSDAVPTTVVVNAAEGEPGTYKDRQIMRANPYAVVEGALIAAHVVGADRIVVAMKAPVDAALSGDAARSDGTDGGAATDLSRMRDVVAEVEAAGWCDAGAIEVFGGPEEYLYGEETALLEVLNGRQPFPRIAPPFRRGADDLLDADPTGGAADDDRRAAAAGNDGGSGAARLGSGGASIELAGPGDDTPAPPALVNNVETLANVPAIVAKGASWFREIGSDDSPGTIVCTVTGSVQHHGVAEIPMGTSVREAIEVVGRGARRGQQIVGVLNGASAAMLSAEALDTPLTHEAMEQAGSALGSASLIVLDDGDDLAAVAAGFARFLAVESCGQCTPCKADGLEIADALGTLCAGDASERDLERVEACLGTVADGARCNLARQTQTLVGSLLVADPASFRAHLDNAAPPTAPLLVGEIAAIVDDRAVLAARAGTKQPDWTYDATWSGTYPAALSEDDADADDTPAAPGRQR